MKSSYWIAATVCVAGIGIAGPAIAGDMCTGYGPQTPRDIGVKAGMNTQAFSLARKPEQLNLCNIHFHTNAEHKGPDFAVLAGAGEHGGYQCNATSQLSEAKLKAPAHGGCHGVKPGDTIEVHWVFSSCEVTPGEGLGSCLSEQCANPELRVESQVFLVVNDANAPSFADYSYGGNVVNGLHLPKALPAGTGTPVLFRGSTTGTKYTQKKCSPFQVTWNVRPNCAKIDINSLNAWCEGNVFKENHAHGVRPLVTAAELLSIID